jgi:Flp pilus assembly protein CpaB
VVARIITVARRIAGRAVLWWMAAALVAALFTVRALADLDRLHARARAGGRPVTVVVAGRDLTYGAVVAAGDVATRLVPEDLVPPGAVREAATAEGRVVAVPLLGGAVVTDRHLAPADRSGLGGVLPADRRLVRVLVGASVRPQPGDVVDVVSVPLPTDPVFEEDAGAEAGAGRSFRATVVVHGAVVAAVDADDLSGEPAVTLLVGPDDALAVAGAAALGPVSVLLAPPEAVAPPGSSPRRKP